MPIVQTISAVHPEKVTGMFGVKLGTFFALERESLSLAHCAACGAYSEAGPTGEGRRC